MKPKLPMELLLLPGGLRTFLTSGDLAYLEGKELEARAFFTTTSVVLSHSRCRLVSRSLLSDFSNNAAGIDL